MNPTSLIATACAASSRYAAPSLRYGPSGDATQPAATGFGMAGSALPAMNDRRLTASARPFTPRLNRHKGNQRSSAECGHPNARVSSAASIYNNPTTPYFCCQVVQRMGSTSIIWPLLNSRQPNRLSLTGQRLSSVALHSGTGVFNKIIVVHCPAVREAETADDDFAFRRWRA